MTIREYLFFNRLTVKDFSKIVGCSPNHISLISNGKVKPSRRLAKDIELATNGQVTAESLLNIKNKGKDELNENI